MTKDNDVFSSDLPENIVLIGEKAEVFAEFKGSMSLYGIRLSMLFVLLCFGQQGQLTYLVGR